MAGKKGAKSRPQARQAAQGNGTPGWVWMLGGFLPGLVLAVLVHLHHESEQGLSGASGGGGDDESAAQDAAEAGNDRPRFEFYELLSEMEVAVPDEPVTPRQRASDTPPDELTDDTTEPAETPDPLADPAEESEPGDDGSRYLVQAGSFQSHEDADSMKAHLAMMGVEAEIQSVEVDGGETWHRVRIGPFDDRERVEQLRQRLRSEDVDSILLRRRG